MVFVDTTFTLPVKPIETVSFSFDTLISEKQTGQERRVPGKTEYRLSVAIATVLLRPICDPEGHEYTDLTTFYESVRGSLDTFRYKNSVEFKATATPETYSEPKATSYGIGVLASPGFYQLVKVYEITRHKHYKTLRHIDAPTLEVFVDSVQTFNFTVDATLGLINILDALSGSETITFNCEFFHEMRFAMDGISATYIGGQSFRDNIEVTNLSLIEEVTTTVNPYVAADFSNIDQTFFFPVQPEFIRQRSFDYKQEALTNEREARTQRYTVHANTDTYQETVWYEAEMRYLLTWYLVCKGRLLGFQVDDRFGRFNEDAIAIETMVYESKAKFLVKQFSMLTKEDAIVPPQFPDFVLDDEIVFVDVGIGFTDDPEPYVPGFLRDSNGGTGGSSSGGASGRAVPATPTDTVPRGSGFGAGAAEDVQFVPPIGFTPLSVTEISGLPIILGQVTATTPFVGNWAILAIPNIPYNGTFNLVDLGYNLVNRGLKWIYYNNTCITTVALADKTTGASNPAFLAVLEVFSDLSWDLTNVFQSTTTSISNGLCRYFHIKFGNLHFRERLPGTVVATGNQPNSVTVVVNTSSFNASSNSHPFEKINNATNAENALSFIFGSVRSVVRYLNNTAEIEFEFGNINLPFSDSLVRLLGGTDANDTTGLVLTGIRLCDLEIDFDNLDICSGGAFVSVTIFLIQSGIGPLFWVGAVLEDPGFNLITELDPQVATFFKNTIVGRGTLVHVPTGTIRSFSDFGIPTPGLGLISSGQNYVASMAFVSGAWRLYFLSFI